MPYLQDSVDTPPEPELVPIRPIRAEPIDLKKLETRTPFTLRALLVVGGILGLLLLIVLPVGLLLYNELSRRGRAKFDDPAWMGGPGGRAEVAEAFAEIAPRDQGRIEEELQPIFTALGVGGPDGERLARLMDVERLFDEGTRHANFNFQLSWNRQSVINGLRQGLAQNLTQLVQQFDWAKTEIRSVKRSESGNELVILTRHRLTDGTVDRMRWWLIRRPEGWRIYDLENLNAPIRVSTLLSIGFNLVPRGGDLSKLKALSESAQTVTQAIMALSQNDTQKAEQLLRKMDNHPPMPPIFETMLFLARGNLALQQGRFKDALAAFDRAEQLKGDLPVLNLLRAVAHNRLGQGDPALKNIEEYRRLLGDDPQVAYQRGEALRWLNRFDEAAVAYRASLDEDPTLPDSFLGLLNCFHNESDRKDIPVRFAKLAEQDKLFTLACEECMDNKRGFIIEDLAPLIRKNHPELPAIDHYLSLAHAWNRQAAKAVPLFQKAQQAQKDADLRDEWRDAFFAAIAQSDRPVLAYEFAKNRRDAFLLLAEQLHKSHRTYDLSELVSVHAQADAVDPALPWYRGSLHVSSGRYAAAEKQFAEAVARPTPRVEAGPFRANRVLARYHTSGVMEAYRAFGPSPEVFKQLLNLCYFNTESTNLAALVAAHEKDDPMSPELPMARFRLALRQGKISEAAVLIKTMSDESSEGSPEVMLFEEALKIGKLSEAYQAVDKARAREAFIQCAEDMEDDDQMNRLRELVRVHRASQPDDVALAYFTAQLHSADDDWAASVAILEPAWQRADAQWKERIRRSLVAALFNTGRMVHAYEKIGPHSSTTQQLVQLLEFDRDYAGMLRLIEAERHHGRLTAGLQASEALANFKLGHVERALTLIGRIPEGDSTIYQVNALLSQFADKGLALEAYRRSKNPRATFQTLSRSELTSKRTASLMSLIAAHRAADPTDPNLWLFEAELYLARGDAAQADQLLSRLPNPVNPGDTFQRESLITRARILRGRAVATYRERGANFEAFRRLASQCVTERRANQLSALIADRKKDHPKEALWKSYQGDLFWLEGNYAECVRQARSSDEYDTFFGSRHEGPDRLIRALVRLGRQDEALQELYRNGATWQNQRLVALVHAARGDVTNVLKAIDQDGGYDWSIQGIYSDEDLGPLLRGEKMAAVRRIWPEPKTKPVIGLFRD